MTEKIWRESYFYEYVILCSLLMFYTFKSKINKDGKGKNH